MPTDALDILVQETKMLRTEMKDLRKELGDLNEKLHTLRLRVYVMSFALASLGTTMGNGIGKALKLI